ncbi:hypothetical protein [Phytohabitans suffuscus]|uniref:Uncharacterized protein n=1 Tax=Phytohabitans suffuscus TaxID=624315 RepID=A0A6F8YDN1_9ACTN|nr:hypothetical protein [Phytohabitans suffuscus]BCB84244.1 hypothetical protein Psuf_015570 [Phytohabitans suffuscus]
MVTAAWLRRLGEDGLADLLRRRPEAMAVPPPVSLGELAERLATPAATVAALRRLDRPALQVAEALTALGGQAGRPALDRLLGAGTAKGERRQGPSATPRAEAEPAGHPLRRRQPRADAARRP